jgi:dTDP-4-amino-4,6-dideoxygalactose transaminase
MNTFDSNFNIEKLGRVACNLFSLAFERLDRTNAARKIIAGLYLRELGLKDIFIPSYPDLNGAAPIRFPILVENGWLRSKWLEKFGGYGISQSYPLDLPSLHICRDDPTGEEMPCPNAKSIAARIITLPTNFLLRENIARKILTCLSKIADAKR